MRRIGIFSRDMLYARMLMHELKGGCTTRDLDIRINDEEIVRNPEITDTIIIDLDGWEGSIEFRSLNLIAFSKYESKIHDKVSSLFKKIFFRPFGIHDLIRTVDGIIDGNSIKVSDGTAKKKDEEIIFFESNGSIIFCGNRVHLSKNEFEILSLLFKNRERTVGREEINTLLGAEGGNMGDVYICHLRSKLARFSKEKLIYTVRNKGYTLKLK